MRTLRLRVTLREVSPRVRRVLDVPAAATLPELHELLQAGLGWTDSHLHEFTVADPDTGTGHGEVRYGMPDPDFDEPDPARDEAAARLRDLGTGFVYLYDFGDGWTHDVAVLGPGGDRPGCVYGEGASPPEDCGGPGGYTELLDVLADPSHAEHTRMRTWAGPTAEFDQAGADALVRATAGAVPASVTLLLELAAGGVRLTPGGRLPRALVRAVQQRRPGWAFDHRPANREEDLPALAALHDLLRDVGLLRLRHGTLTPTRAAADELATIRRLRSWFGPDDAFSSVLAGTTIATLAQHGPHSPDQLAKRVYPQLDRWVHRDGSPLSSQDLRAEISRLATPAQGLDLIQLDWSVAAMWSAGDSARTLLPRATALAHIWSLPRYRADTSVPDDERPPAKTPRSDHRTSPGCTDTRA